jgi:type IV pilus assembly protein PilF
MRSLKKWLILLSCYLLLSCVTSEVDAAGNEIGVGSGDSKKLSEIYINLALLYQDQGVLATALERANMAVKVCSNNPHAYLVRANIYAAIGDMANADTDYKKTLHLSPNNYDALVAYGTFLCTQKKYDLAATNFNLAISNRLYYNRGLGYYSKGKCLFEQKQYVVSEELLKKSVDCQDTPNLVYFYLASIALSNNFPDSALSYLDKYNGTVNADILSLRIKILQQLQKSNKYNTSNGINYQEQINVLKKQLLTNFPNSVAAQTITQY